jgi:hypothetical protein
MRGALILAVALAAWASPGAAQQSSTPPAAPTEAKQPNGPTPGYILYRMQRRMGVLFRREMSPAEETAELAAAREEMRRGHQEQVTQWEELDTYCRSHNERALRCDYRGPRPAEIGEMTEALLDPDSMVVSVDRRDSAAEVGGSYLYLVEARPGTYAFYGQRDMDGDHPVGVCLCMGSLRFEVTAGQVVDIGTITFPGLEAANARPSERQAMTTAMENSIVLVPPHPDSAPPAIVGDRPFHRAVLRAAEKQDNYFGLYIDRHPAMPGVLRYERDRVIDDATGTDPAPITDPAPATVTPN